MELYIHIPFCVRKCRYCDFLSFPVGDVWECTAGADKSCGSSQFCPAGQVDSYLYQLMTEMEQMAARPEIRGMASPEPLLKGSPVVSRPALSPPLLQRPVTEETQVLHSSCSPGQL